MSTKIQHHDLTARRNELGLNDATIAQHLNIKKSRWRAILEDRCILSADEAERLGELFGWEVGAIPHRCRPWCKHLQRQIA